jgi:site-specific DNA recombinase
MTTLRAVIYMRVSTDDQAETGTGLETQEITCRNLAEQLHATVVAVERDSGISGTVYPRPGLECALSLLESGQANALIAYNASRLGRRTSVTLAVWERIQAAGGRLFLADGGEVTEDNELLFTIQGGFAQYEWREIRKRMRSGHRRRAEQGVMTNRTLAPYAYRILQKGEVGPNGEQPGQYIVITEQAYAVQEMYRRLAAGDSLRQICFWLQASGAPLPHGLRTKSKPTYWYPSSVTRILKNTAYKGYVFWGKTEVKKVNGRKVCVPTPPEKQVRIPVPSLVDDALWETCQKMLQANRVNGGCRHDRKYPLSGLMFCPKCDTRMCSRRMYNDRGKLSGAQRGDKKTWYACRRYWKGSNAAGIVCTPTVYQEEQALAVLRRILITVFQCRDLIECALEAHRRRQRSGYSQEEHVRVINDLRELDAKEQATAEGYARAIQLGTRPEVFEKLLSDIATERKRLLAKKWALEAKLLAVQEETEAEVADIAQEVVGNLLEVLDTEELTPVEKNRFLSRFIEKIYPQPSGYRVHFRPFPKNPSVIPVACARTRAMRSA